MDLLLPAIVWEPYASPLRIGAAAVALAALAVFACVRIFAEHPRAALFLLAMRLTVIAVVTTLLFGPSEELPTSPVGDRPRLHVLVDTSESMRTADCDDDSRIACVARRILSPEQLARLQQEFDVRLEGFDTSPRPLAIEWLHLDPDTLADGRATNLAESVSATIARLDADEQPALLVISDGRDTSDAPVQAAAALAEARGLPIYTVGVGGDTSSTDLALLAVPMQESLLPEEPGGILVKVYQSGFDGQSGVVQLQAGEETQRVPIVFTDAQVAEVQLPIARDEPGQYELEISIPPLPGEAEDSNNSQTVFVEVMKRRIRVLLLEGEPFWDSKFVAQSLRKDQQIELTQITQVGAERQEKIVSRGDEAAPRVPETSDGWTDYDVVLIGRGLEHLLTPAAAAGLAQHVSEGGGHVVFLRGPAWNSSSPAGAQLAAALRVLEPVVWGDEVVADAPVELTPSGRTAAWFAPGKMGVDADDALARLPGFERLTSVDRVKGGTLVLAGSPGVGGPNSDTLPALTRMAYGRGQVVALHGEGLWRWSLLPPELEDLRGFYDTFWSNLVRWLALGGDFQPGQPVSLQLSRTSARLGDELIVDVACRQEASAGGEPRLTVTSPDGQPVEVLLNRLPGATPRYRATLVATEPGVHEARVTLPGQSLDLSRKYSVYDVNLERLQTSANFLALEMLAEHSGGEMFDVEESADLFDQLQRHRAAILSPPRTVYLWDRGVVMTLLLAWAGAEWLFRRAAGLW
jgi:hypothetical protein